MQWREMENFFITFLKLEGANKSYEQTFSQQENSRKKATKKVIIFCKCWKNWGKNFKNFFVPKRDGWAISQKPDLEGGLGSQFWFGRFVFRA